MKDGKSSKRQGNPRIALSRKGSLHNFIMQMMEVLFYEDMQGILKRL